ncbi:MULTISPECIES: L-threonate dehydrogenase [unclassified Rhizobium]|uniref:L-threonate dehydrogenase n=1 Tax=unclassified Rhizobium TaxID=2613769 RepID=UPI0007137E93|nr:MULTISPECIES: L-threonate dehydrogenase [unclassified Rhizobium]KQS88158.1 3-hydroxyisobutyrate dehydrogenase [Rhizobium sp. Leaf391]KQT00655.1 3-hydroxyisobutyrate dehydrogenase [Rhizobium sp. Leaf386]KQU09128.1 3-hydroxyisobutyrate dehydrogenase [Rhizobium sp. Leaf453]
MATHVHGEPGKVAVIGLGSMGFGMAESLLRAGFAVAGCDVTEQARQRLQAAGGSSGALPREVAQDAPVVVSVVVNAAQTEQVLFGTGGAIESMQQGAVFISSATMSPADAERLAARAKEKGVFFLDAPISGGAKRAASGELTIMASGEPEAFEKSEAVLSALAQKVYRLGDKAGVGASVKMINQLLAGVHIAVACEAITLASKIGLDLATVYDVITASAGNSWMFENRMPHVLDGDYSPLSSVEIFVKDLGIIQDMARSERYPAPIAAAALQMYLAAAGAGMGKDDDSSVARIYAQLSGATLPEHKS